MIDTLRRAVLRAAAIAFLSAQPVFAAQNSVVMPSTGPMSLGTFVTDHLNPALISMGG